MNDEYTGRFMLNMLILKFKSSIILIFYKLLINI